MTDPQLSADHTGPHARRGHLDDLQADVIWKWTSIDEDSSELVDSPLTLERVAGEQSHLKAGNFDSSLGIHLKPQHSPSNTGLS